MFDEQDKYQIFDIFGLALLKPLNKIKQVIKSACLINTIAIFLCSTLFVISKSWEWNDGYYKGVSSKQVYLVCFWLCLPLVSVLGLLTKKSNFSDPLYSQFYWRYWMFRESASASQSRSQRVFYDLLLRVGAIGKYQYVCLLIWSALYMVSTSSTFCLPYLFYQPPYHCKDLNQQQCLSHVCSLPYELRETFRQGLKRTLINKFGDYRCEGSQKINEYQSIIYFSAIFGIIAGIYLNMFFRKKILIEACVFISIACFAGLLLSNNITVIIILLSINQATQLIVPQLILCFITEAVQQEERGKHTMIIFFFFSVASILNGLFFKVLQWEQVIIYYFILIAVLTLAGVKFYIQQTPFDLITNYTPQVAYQSLNWIAEQNGNAKTHKIKIIELQIMKEQYQQNMKEKQKQNLSFIDLFRFESLRMDVICCFFLHLFISYSYYAPILALSQFSADIYLNGIVYSFASTISSVCCYFVISNLSRKKMVSYTTIASLVFIPPIYITSQCLPNCSRQFKWIETVSVFLLRLILEVAYQAYYFIQNEIFPTQIRPQAILVTGGGSFASKMLVPMVSNFNQRNKLVFPLSFITSAAFVLGIMRKIRETVGIPPPEMIKQLAYEHK